MDVEKARSSLYPDKMGSISKRPSTKKLSKKKPSSRRRKLLISGIVLAASIFMLEAGLRIIFSPSLEILKLFELDDYRLLRLKPGARSDPRPGMIVSRFAKSNSDSYNVRINLQGFRAGRDFSLTPDPYTLRIICLGDSITFGFGLEEESTYPYLLQSFYSSLPDTGKVEVINAGCPGLSTRQALIWLDRDLVRFNPHILIVQLGYNDSHYAWKSSPIPFYPLSDKELLRGRPGAWLPIEKGFVYAIGRIFNHSIIVKALKTEYSIYESKKDSFSMWMKMENPGHELPSTKPRKKNKRKKRVSVSEYKKNLLEMCRLCSQRKIKVILIDSWPTSFQYRKAINEIAQQTGVQVISQFNIIEKARINPEFITSQERFLPLLDKVKARLGEKFLKDKPEYHLVLDYVHPNEIANIIFVEELLRNIN